MSSTADTVALAGGKDTLVRARTARGRIKQAPESLDAPMTVVLVEYSGQYSYDIPGSNWTAQGTRLPAAGDECLVVFDDRGDAWVPTYEGITEYAQPGQGEIPDLAVGEGLVWTADGWAAETYATAAALAALDADLGPRMDTAEADVVLLEAADTALDARLDKIEASAYTEGVSSGAAETLVAVSPATGTMLTLNFTPPVDGHYSLFGHSIARPNLSLATGLRADVRVDLNTADLDGRTQRVVQIHNRASGATENTVYSGQGWKTWFNLDGGVAYTFTLKLAPSAVLSGTGAGWYYWTGREYLSMGIEG